MPSSIRPGDELAGRYRLEDLLDERDGGRFYRAWDRVLARYVAVHVISAEDDRADALREAARHSVGVQDPHVLRVLDADERDGICFVVNEWGSGRSLDVILADEGPMGARRAAWLISEVAATIALAHDNGVTHGRLVPENVLIDHNGQVRVIGLAVDAALHGLPAGRVFADVTDLAGNLYAALTGQWTGVSQSGVPPAHMDGSRVLRPRQVRAGIPRELDHLCDDLLNDTHHRSDNVTTAHGVHEVLRDFVGDYAQMAGREAALAAAAGLPQYLPQTSEVPPAPGLDEPPVDQLDADDEPTVRVTPRAPHTEPAEESATGPEPAEESAAGTEPTVLVPLMKDRSEDTGPVTPFDPTDVPTQAGLPVFHDDADDVGWFSQSTEPARKPPPPPALEDPAPKPLFAPEPEHGQPVRTPRPGRPITEPGDDYLGWGTGTGAGITTGTGAVPTYVDDEVPGRNWLRLAMVIGIVTLILFVVVFAFNLGNGRSFLLGDSSTTDDDAAANARAVTGLTAEDIDPQGSAPRQENPDTVGNTVDGDPSTVWTTLTYNENFGPGGLKTGLGVVVDLGEVRAPQTVEITVPEGGETGFSLFLSNRRPSFVAGLTRVARQTGSGTVEVSLNGQNRGRYLVVWLTSLPGTDDGRYQGEIAEIRVTA